MTHFNLKPVFYLSSLLAALACLSGCYETNGPVIAATEADGKLGGRITLLKAGPYCTEAWTDVSESGCFELTAADQGAYTLTPENNSDNIIDTTPFTLHIYARPLKTGAYAGYYIAEACRTVEVQCTTGLVKPDRNTEDFEYYLPVCKTRECRFSTLEQAVTKFESLPHATDRSSNGRVVWQGTRN